MRSRPVTACLTLPTAVGALATVIFAAHPGAQAQPPSAFAQQAVPDNVAPHPAPDQPIPYSHKTHLALGLQCDTCHAGTAQAREMGFPDDAACMACHASIAADRPAIEELSRHAAANEPVPWVRVYEVLPGITWAHGPHLSAGVQCGACHGDVAQLDAMAMTTSVVAMASCIGCHEARGANTACATCHAWPPAQQASLPR